MRVLLARRATRGGTRGRGRGDAGAYPANSPFAGAELLAAKVWAKSGPGAPGERGKSCNVRPHRRRSPLRPAETQGPWLQCGAQAHRGRAAAVVLPGDRLGLPVWQDMPAMDSGRTPDAAARTQGESGFRAPVDRHRSPPSLIMRVSRNEGRGQCDRARIADMVKAYDPARLVDDMSGVDCCGAVDGGNGDVVDHHDYVGPATPSRARRGPRSSASTADSASGLRPRVVPGRRVRLRGPGEHGRAERPPRRPAGRDPGELHARGRAFGRRPHPDHRRRERGQRPAHLRPPGRRGRGGARTGGRPGARRGVPHRGRRRSRCPPGGTSRST